MKKKEAMNQLRNKLGFVPYPHLFDLFDENEIIPDYLINCDPNNSKTENDLIIQLLDLL